MPELAQISIKTAYFRGQELKWICLTGPTDSRHISVTYTRQVSSSINEPMSALAWEVGLTLVFSVVYKNN